MTAGRWTWRSSAGAAPIAVLSALLTTLACAPGSAVAADGYARVEPACGAPAVGEATCFALVRVPVPASEARAPGVRPLAARPSSVSVGPAGGLTPADLASAYGYEPGSAAGGQTIAIVDAFDDPNIESDLEKFDVEYGLPECTTSNGCFKKVGQSSVLPPSDKSGWSVETSLDVEAAHAVCQSCHILLAESENALRVNLALTTKKAEEMGATVVSNSYGGPELSAEPTAAETAPYNDPGVVVAAATGDFGFDWWTGPLPDPESPNVPSSLPSVVSVGGTTLQLAESGKRAKETVWNGNGRLNKGGFSHGASGGGCSKFFAAEPWQSNVAGFTATGCGSKRLSADVAAVADPFTGFDVWDTFNCGASCESIKAGANWLTIGGTSLSTPIVSALYALAGGAQGVSYPSLILYGHLGDASLFDVTEGGNGYCNDSGAPCGVNAKFGERLDCEGTTACNATTGFDGPSGVGAPSGAALFKVRLPTAAITTPSNPIAGSAAAFDGTASTDPYPGAARSYGWTFGDGAVAAGASPSHTYAAPGTYTVTLTVTDSYGLKSPAATAKVTVAERSKHELEEEAAKKAKEEAEKKAAEEATKKKAAEEAAKKAQEEAAARRTAEEVAARAVAFYEAAVKAAEAAAAAAQSGQGTLGFKAAATPIAALAAHSLVAGAGGDLKLAISCPADESSCEGVVTLRTLNAVLARRPSVLTVASGHFKVAGGKTASVRLHLVDRARRLLARKHTLRLRVTLLAHDPAGATHTSDATATLRGSGPHH